MGIPKLFEKLIKCHLRPGNDYKHCEKCKKNKFRIIIDVINGDVWITLICLNCGHKEEFYFPESN
jgi:hypothetical protein